MRIEKTIEKTEVVKKHILDEIVCNKCGNQSGKLQDEYDFSANDFQNFSTHFGFGSSFDMESWNFDLCEFCLVDLIKTFKYSPSGFANTGYMPHSEQLTFEYWKETGEVDLDVGMTSEEIEAQGGSIYMEDDED